MLSFAVGAGEAPVLAASILRGSGICCRIASQIGDLLSAVEDTRKSGSLERASCSGWEKIGCNDLESSGNGSESNPDSALVRPVGADLLGLSMLESVRVVCGYRTAGIGSLALGNWQRDQLWPQHSVGRRLLHSGIVLSKPAKEAKAEEKNANDGAQGPAHLVGMNANGSRQGDDAIEQNAESEAQEFTLRSNEEGAVDGGGQGHAPDASKPVADVQVPASMDDSPRQADDAKEDRGKNVKGRNFAREQICTVSIVAKAFEPEMVEHFQDSVLAVWVRDEKPTSEALTDGSGQKVEALPAGQTNSNSVSLAFGGRAEGLPRCLLKQARWRMLQNLQKIHMFSKFGSCSRVYFQKGIRSSHAQSGFCM
jgi:hypothetical protein